MIYKEFGWALCINGYDLVDQSGVLVRDFNSKNSLGWVLVPRSSDFVRIRPFEKRSSLLLREFAEAEGPEDYRELAKFYGLLSGKGQKSETISIYRTITNKLRIVLRLADEASSANRESVRQERYAEICDYFNSVNWTAKETALSPRPNGLPALHYQPKDLHDALWACFYNMLQFENGHKQCSLCDNWFIPIRDRKSINAFCSKRCSNRFNNEKNRRRKAEGLT